MKASDLRKILNKKMGGLENGKEEADIIIKHFGKITRADLLLGTNISERVAKDSIDAARRRLSGEPLQYILGEWGFYGLQFSVRRGALIPRQETEILVEEVLKEYGKRRGTKIADLCAGTGCIGITLDLKLNGSRVDVYENSKEAVFILKENAKKLNSKVRIFKRDVLADEQVRASEEGYDLIVCNPPYLTEADMNNLQTELKFEPKEALFGGKDGLYYYKTIVPLWKQKLKSNGRFYFEIGDNQSCGVIDIFKKNNMVEIKSFKDYNNVIRVVSASKK